MNNQRDKKRLERKAKGFLVNKEIPSAKMDVVRSLMNNAGLGSDERYRAIIEIVQNCPDKTFVSLARIPEVAAERKRARADTNPPTEPVKTVFGPTETSYYIDDLIARYRELKLVKKRYLVHKDNRWGFGFRKRLIPANILLKCLRAVKEIQSTVASRLNAVMKDLLNDPAVTDPSVYNYLKIIKRMLSDIPFVSNTYDALKWMERSHFEREVRDYTAAYFSILLISAEDKEKIYASIEYQLRSAAERDGAYNSPGRASASAESIGQFLSWFKSFIPHSVNDKSPLDIKLKSEFGIRFFDLIMMINQTLCFQRPVSREEIAVYYSVKASAVSREAWDCTETMLQNAGKDPESVMRRELDRLTARLAEFEPVNMAMGYNIDGIPPLFRIAEEQWRYVDKKHYDVSSVYEENFFGFIDCLVNYFNGVYSYFFSGGVAVLNPANGRPVQGIVFDPGWFRVFSADFTSLLEELHFFRTNNPSLSLTRAEVKKIVSGQINTMSHVAAFIRKIGDLFYYIGTDLCSLISGGDYVSKPAEGNLKPAKREADGSAGTAVLYGCVIEDIPLQGMTMKRFNGMPVVSGWGSHALVNEIAAFCYHISFECFNERLLSMMNGQRAITARIEEIEKSS